MKAKQSQSMPREQFRTEGFTQHHFSVKSGAGFSLVEIILSASIFALVVMAFVGVFLYGQEATVLAGQRASASLLAEEGLEALRNIRDAGFTNLVDGTHGLAISGSQWQLAGSADINGVFTRQVAISSIDSRRKQVTATITWQQNLQRSGLVSAVTRFTNWMALGIGNWAFPSLASSFNLTPANSGIAGANSVSIAFANNLVYLGRANSAGREFYIFDVSDPASPQLLGQRDLNGTPNDIVVAGNYAYIASTDDLQELQIVDISDPATVGLAGKLTSVNLTAANSGNAAADARALSLSGNYLLMVRGGGDEFLVFDLTNPSAPGNPVGRTPTLTGTPADVTASGGYAYVASSDNAAELQIVDITDKTAPSRVQVFNLTSGSANTDALSAGFAGNHVFVGRASSGAPEFYAINVANPMSPLLSDTQEIGNDVMAISMDQNTAYAFLATADTGNDFKIVDASVPTNISLLGQLNLANGSLDIVYDTTLDRAFIASSADAEELQIVRPQ